MGLYGMTKAEQRAKVKAGAVYIATTTDFKYGAIAVGKTEAEARSLAIAKVQENCDRDAEYIDSSVSVSLLAPGESEVD